MTDPDSSAKRAAARAAADLVEPGMRLGFGTGSTFVHVLDRLAERVRDEGLEFAGGVPTSDATAAHARGLGLPVASLDDFDALDLAIDGADEVDSGKNLIKGGGGALVREKIVAAAAARLVIIVSANKIVDRLGATFRLPLEIMTFGAAHTRKRVAALGLTPTLRGAASDPFVSDNGNWILDCGMPETADLLGLERTLNAIPGVVDNGLFLGMAERVLVGEADGSVREIC